MSYFHIACTTAMKSYGPTSGGFQIQNLDAEKGYIYVQFESLKRGYIDDVEFLVTLGL